MNSGFEGSSADDGQKSQSRPSQLKRPLTLKVFAAFVLALHPEQVLGFQLARPASALPLLKQGPSFQLAALPTYPDPLALQFPKYSETLPITEAMSAVGAAVNDGMLGVFAAMTKLLTDPAGAFVEAPIAAAATFAGASDSALAAMNAGSVAALDAALAVSKIMIEASGAIGSMDPSVALLAVVGSALQLLFDDGVETSFTRVARWPKVRLYTFGEAAYKPGGVDIASKKPPGFKFSGMRVNVDRDPVSNTIGQAIGNVHEALVPVLNLDSRNMSDVTQDLQKASGAEPFGAADIRKTVSRDHSQTDAETFNRRGMSSSRDFSNIFVGSDWSRHDMIVYLDLIQQKLKEHWQNSFLETYRAGKIVQDISYVDAADESEIISAVKALNTRMDPIHPERPLFAKQFEHVMSIQFYTPASLQARLFNEVGFHFSSDQAPVAAEGIMHNVHLIKDADKNGYLTFQGTANLGTWLDVNLAFGRYEGNAKNPSTSDVDDVRWEAIEKSCLFSCHRGMAHTLKTFVSDERFPELAKEVLELNSLTMTGFSLGGCLASMFALSVSQAHDLQGILDRMLDSKLYRAFFNANNTVSAIPTALHS